VSLIDVIIPIYNAAEDVTRCVVSVRQHTGENCRIVLIDDCSSDERIASFFTALEALADDRIVLVKNLSNIGFIGTVNRGMSLSNNDVVLLNSDTIVTSNWLEKLRRCALSDERIGTITPFSNNAEICSFPSFCQNNSLEGVDIEAVNRAMEATATPVYPDIPTAVGFCMYIRRSLLDAIGEFDAATFGAGYGEENDFCMRALKAGYRNVLCEDTFVAHTGGRSFSGRSEALKARNSQLLFAKHPEYLGMVQEFIATDPIESIRARAQARLSVPRKRESWFTSIVKFFYRPER
jgi:GT2 family glycosyltransferase